MKKGGGLDVRKFVLQAGEHVIGYLTIVNMHNLDIPGCNQVKNQWLHLSRSIREQGHLEHFITEAVKSLQPRTFGRIGRNQGDIVLVSGEAFH
ncbi:hypothetical protein D3C71_2064900 [compost metagenome]